MIRYALYLFTAFFIWSCNKREQISEAFISKTWRFKIGDSLIYSQEHFDDSGWTEIKSGHPWENQGYKNIDGHGWYRKKIFISEDLKTMSGKGSLHLFLGKIDDNDEVYLNGHLIGFNCINNSNGQKLNKTIPLVNSYATINRLYTMDTNSDFIKWGAENVLAIRVYDQGGEGGLRDSTLYMYTSEWKKKPNVSINLSEGWKFIPRDSADYNSQAYNHIKWFDIQPGKEWEQQGFPDHDGFGWYRITFKFPKGQDLENINFNLGAIDDYDQFFLNGYLIGQNGEEITQVGKLNRNFREGPSGFDQTRNYYLQKQDSRVNWNGSNLIAIRVFDAGGGGGLTHGNPNVIINPSPEIKLVTNNFYGYSDTLEDTTLKIANLNNYTIKRGSLTIRSISLIENKVIYSHKYNYLIKPNDVINIPVSLPPLLNPNRIIIDLRDQDNLLLLKEVYDFPFTLKR